MPDNHRALHWAQAKVYAHLMCDARSLPEIDVALVYFDIVSERETVLTQTLGAAELATFFAEQRALSAGPSARRPIGRRAMRRCARWCFRTAGSAAASASWRWPSIAPHATSGA